MLRFKTGDPAGMVAREALITGGGETDDSDFTILALI
jgi:hypothetical protein